MLQGMHVVLQATVTTFRASFFSLLFERYLGGG